MEPDRPARAGTAVDDGVRDDLRGQQFDVREHVGRQELAEVLRNRVPRVVPCLGVRIPARTERQAVRAPAASP